MSTGDQALPWLVEAVADALKSHRYNLSVAESCTGGMLAGAITDLPGSSEFFLGGIVAYANEVKEGLLSVPTAVLREHGAVSDPTARAMAEGVRERLRSSVGVGITGVAGPGGGTPSKPVGLVYVAVATPEGTRARRDLWAGGRGQVRAASVRAALELILDCLGEPSGSSSTKEG